MTRRIAAALALAALILAVLALLVTLQRHRDLARGGTSISVISDAEAHDEESTQPMPGELR